MIFYFLIYFLYDSLWSTYDVKKNKINNFKSKMLSTNKNRKNDDFIYSLNFETWVMWASQCYVDRK